MAAGDITTQPNQNKAGRPGQWAVYLFSYVYGLHGVIMAVLHSVGMKHRSLASASENACAWSGERFLFERAVVQGRLKLPFRKCCIFFVFYLLLCVAIWASLNLSRIASFKRSWELLLEVRTWLYVLSITLELKIKRIVKPNIFFTIMCIQTSNRSIYKIAYYSNYIIL